MPPITSPPVTIPEDVARFCAAHDITDDLHLAIRLAEEIFAPVDRWQVAIEPDPETDDAYVVVDLWGSMSVESAVERNHDMARRWVGAAKPVAQPIIRVLSHLTE
jgi:hypothetical protein